MDSTRAPEPQKPPKPGRSGIALFMVIAAMTVLSILVTEFVYIAQVNQRMAFDGLDQVRALYLAKTGFKLSLLRLKAYKNVKSALSSAGGQAAAPRALLEKIWSFPFIYPFPANLPGLSATQKEEIQKFQQDSNLTGSFTANIESESARYNLNTILSAFAPKPAPSPTAKPGDSTSPAPQPSGTPTPGAASPPPPQSGGDAKFDVQAARKSLTDLLFQILNSKFQADPEFASEYRDTKVDELAENIVAWADRTYDKSSRWGSEQIPPKRAPFYSLQELRMVPGIDDGLYELFSPNLTVTTTPGVNANTIREPTLKALLPEAKPEEIQEFFKYRDSEEEDHSFKNESDFFNYVKEHMAAYRKSSGDNQLQEDFRQRNIRIVTDESVFRVVVQATVNQATRRIEALVQFAADKGEAAPKGSKKPAPNSTPPRQEPAESAATGAGTASAKADAGLKITFMRIL